MTRKLQSLCVYAASSRQLGEHYLEAARALGGELARRQIEIVFGGGSVGLMGALADAALAEGGRVVGILPRFMHAVEWGHKGLTEMRLVETMHERKHAMIDAADGFIALPGGCGTLEELFEVITWKRLGLHGKPIAMLNVAGFYDACAAQLERCIEDGFMNAEHGRMWSVVNRVEELLPALEAQPEWDASMRDIARP